MKISSKQSHRSRAIDRPHRIFPHQLSWLINNPLRRLVISPETLVNRLPLSNSSRILEVGPGSGYFSRALAARVPQGQLELLDIQPQMLAKAERRLRASGFENIGLIVGDIGEDLPVPICHFDVAILASVLGEVSHQNRCLSWLHRALSPTGTLAFHEAIPDPDRIPFEALRALVETNGFKLDRYWGGPWNYTATFVKSQHVNAGDAGMSNVGE